MPAEPDRDPTPRPHTGRIVRSSSMIARVEAQKVGLPLPFLGEHPDGSGPTRSQAAKVYRENVKPVFQTLTERIGLEIERTATNDLETEEETDDE